MNPEALFSLVNASVLPGWALLVFAPGWRWTQRICALLLPSLLALAYAGLFASSLGEADGGFGTLEGVVRLFSNRTVLLVGWIHYLAFDLFVGAWLVRDSRGTGIPHAAVVPCLALTFMLGPTGLLAYLLLRAGWKRQWDVTA